MAYVTEEGIKIPPFYLTFERTASRKYTWKCKIAAQSINEMMDSLEEIRKRITDKIKQFEQEDKNGPY